MNIQQNMCNHFLDVADSYNDIRTTDLKPIMHIKEKIEGMKEIKAADIGCGGGRYDLLLFQHIDNIHLTCIDINKAMVKETSDYLKSNGILNFETMQSSIDDLSLEGNAYDCFFTFNAIHHFDFVTFLNKVSMSLKEGGLIFIYTRLKSQNARNIWGKYFPLFTEKEDRLYELDEMKRWVESVDSMTIESIDSFSFKRTSTLKRLLNQVNCKHYSTFCLYSNEEFEDAARDFERNINADYDDINCIEWYDENIMLTLQYRLK